MKQGAKLALLFAWKYAEQSLSGCSGLQRLWSMPWQRFLPEAASSIHFHFLCCLIYFQERLQLPASPEALKFLFFKSQAITAKISISLPCWLQLIALFTHHHASKAERLCGVMHLAGIAFTIQRPNAEFFIRVKFSLLLAPMVFSTFLGFCLSSPQLSSSKLKMWLWTVMERFLTAMHYATNLSYLTISCCTVRRTFANKKTTVYDTNTVGKHCHF